MTALENIEIALAIETLAYHDKNYLDSTIAGSNAKRSEIMQRLLRDAAKELSQKTTMDW